MHICQRPVRMGAAYDIFVGTALGVGLIMILNLIKFIVGRGEGFKMPEPLKIKVGFITEETLKTYDGYDITKPLLIAVRGKLYDVGKDRDKYGPGRPCLGSFATNYLDAQRCMQSLRPRCLQLYLQQLQ